MNQNRSLRTALLRAAASLCAASFRTNSFRLFSAVHCMVALLVCPLMEDRTVAEEFLSGIRWSQPSIVTPGDSGGSPSDAVVLFDGTDLSAWENGEN